jgi:hypothetical protein
MEIRGWPSPYTVVRTVREIRSGDKRILERTWGSIVPPVPAGRTESADDPFIIDIRGLQIRVTRADIEEAP